MGHADAPLRIEVVHCAGPDAADVVMLTLPAGSTVRDALERSGLQRRLATNADDIGVWGRVAPLDQPLRDGDRVELYRALQADPMETRRRRAEVQRSRR